MAASSKSVSVIVEWANAGVQGGHDAVVWWSALRQCLDELHQARNKAQLSWLAGPLEILICVDAGSDDMGALDRILKPDSGPGYTLQRLSFPGAGYYELKNLGARAAAGQLLVFLDSDALPHKDWLIDLLASMSFDQRAISAGVTYIDPQSLYDRAMACTWIFDPYHETVPGALRSFLHANNFVIERDLLLEKPFPTIPGATRGACALLSEELRASGHDIHCCNAQVTHPSPRLLQRAMAHGRDRVMTMRFMGRRWAASPGGSLYRWAKHMAQVAVRSWHYRRAVGLKWFEVPLACGIGATYYSVFLVGELATQLAPKAMQRRFRI